MKSASECPDDFQLFRTEDSYGVSGICDTPEKFRFLYEWMERWEKAERPTER